jgi:predicted porin
VAAGLLVATTAQAQDEEEMMMAEPITASISGYYHTAFIGYSGDDDAGLHGQEIDENMEIQVSGSTTLDNGLTVGVGIDLRPGSGNNEQVTISGGFGSLAYGQIPGAGDSVNIGAPWGNSLFHVNGPWFGPRGGGKGVNTGNEGIGIERAKRVRYTSPNLNGFSLALSYAPDDKDGNYAGQSSTNGGQSEHISAGLSFTQAVMGGSFSAAVSHDGYTTEVDGAACDDSANNCNPDVLRFGASVSIDDVTIGGGYVEADETGPGERTVMNFGIAYTMGDTSFDLNWANSSSDDASAKNSNGSDSDTFSLGVGYQVGPGISVSAAIQTGSEENGVASGMDNDWSAVMIGTAINF